MGAVWGAIKSGIPETPAVGGTVNACRLGSVQARSVSLSSLMECYAS